MSGTRVVKPRPLDYDGRGHHGHGDGRYEEVEGRSDEGGFTTRAGVVVSLKTDDARHGGRGGGGGRGGRGRGHGGRGGSGERRGDTRRRDAYASHDAMLATRSRRHREEQERRERVERVERETRDERRGGGERTPTPTPPPSPTVSPSPHSRASRSSRSGSTEVGGEGGGRVRVRRGPTVERSSRVSGGRPAETAVVARVKAFVADLMDNHRTHLEPTLMELITKYPRLRCVCVILCVLCHVSSLSVCLSVHLPLTVARFVVKAHGEAELVSKLDASEYRPLIAYVKSGLTDMLAGLTSPARVEGSSVSDTSERSPPPVLSSYAIATGSAEAPDGKEVEEVVVRRAKVKCSTPTSSDEDD